jgi:hypothetical protein
MGDVKQSELERAVKDIVSLEPKELVDIMYQRDALKAELREFFPMREKLEDSCKQVWEAYKEGELQEQQYKEFVAEAKPVIEKACELQEKFREACKEWKPDSRVLDSIQARLQDYWLASGSLEAMEKGIAEEKECAAERGRPDPFSKGIGQFSFYVKSGNESWSSRMTSFGSELHMCYFAVARVGPLGKGTHDRYEYLEKYAGLPEVSEK